MDKVSIRFFDDREVRAIWDDEYSKWWFSVLDIVAVLTDQDDYTKTRNYWKYLKAKLKKENNQLVSATTQLKLLASDGKRYKSDVLDYEGMIALGKTFPGTKANRFIELFTYSDETIDGKSKTKAYARTFDEIVDKYVEMNIAHPFMEGNGRSTRIWLYLMLKRAERKCVDWSKIAKNDYHQAMIKSVIDSQVLKSTLNGALTEDINSREMFMKGIDYSYYYEEN